MPFFLIKLNCSKLEKNVLLILTWLYNWISHLTFCCGNTTVWLCEKLQNQKSDPVIYTCTCKLVPSHSTRSPWTLSGCPTLGPFESFPCVLIRRRRRKNVAPTSRSSRTYEYVFFSDAGTSKEALKTPN